MSRLIDLLKSFNRKERYWVLRGAFREQIERLPASFAADLSESLGGAVDGIDPGQAWWGMDYHFDWLCAAVAAYSRGQGPADLRADKTSPPQGEDNGLSATQEDVDFVVAHGRDLILLEAKAFGAWSNAQLESKRDRLRRLLALKGDDCDLRLHFVLWSVNAPNKVKLETGSDWEPWLRPPERRGDKPSGWFHYMKMTVETPPAGAFLSIRRERRGSSGEDVSWLIEEKRAPTG